MSAAAVGWQDIASALASPTSRPSRSNPRRARGRRVISQETVRQIREDAKTMTRAELAEKHDVSRNYLYLVIDCGLRDDERERLR